MADFNYKTAWNDFETKCKSSHDKDQQYIDFSSVSQQLQGAFNASSSSPTDRMWHRRVLEHMYTKYFGSRAEAKAWADQFRTTTVVKYSHAANSSNEHSAFTNAAPSNTSTDTCKANSIRPASTNAASTKRRKRPRNPKSYFSSKSSQSRKGMPRSAVDTLTNYQHSVAGNSMINPRNPATRQTHDDASVPTTRHRESIDDNLFSYLTPTERAMIYGYITPNRTLKPKRKLAFDSKVDTATGMPYGGRLIMHYNSFHACMGPFVTGQPRTHWNKSEPQHQSQLNSQLSFVHVCMERVMSYVQENTTLWVLCWPEPRRGASKESPAFQWEFDHVMDFLEYVAGLPRPTLPDGIHVLYHNWDVSTRIHYNLSQLIQQELSRGRFDFTKKHGLMESHFGKETRITWGDTLDEGNPDRGEQVNSSRYGRGLGNFVGNGIGGPASMNQQGNISRYAGRDNFGGYGIGGQSGQAMVNPQRNSGRYEAERTRHNDRNSRKRDFNDRDDDHWDHWDPSMEKVVKRQRKDYYH